jgi:hypothetical protein
VRWREIGDRYANIRTDVERYAGFAPISRCQSHHGEVGGIEIGATGRPAPLTRCVLALHRVADEVAGGEVNVERKKRAQQREDARD